MSDAGSTAHPPARARRLARHAPTRETVAFTCGGRDAGHLPTVRDFHAARLAAGIDHTYREVAGLAQEHDKLVTLYRTTWFDDHTDSFRRAGAQPSFAAPPRQQPQAAPRRPTARCGCHAWPSAVSKALSR